MPDTVEASPETLFKKQDRERSLQLLAELELAEDAKKRRKLDRGISFFSPNAAQLAAMSSRADEVVFVSGNRGGKSTAGATQLVHHLTRQYPSCPCHGEWYSAERRFTKPIKAVVVATEYPIIERTIEPRILEYLPKQWIAGSPKRTPQGYLRRILGVDGGSVDILSGEMDQMAFESADWDYAWIDEPCQRSKYVAIHRGMIDRFGKSMLTFTPLVEPWMKEELVDKVDNNFRQVVKTTTYENLEDIHGQAILTRKSIERFESLLSEDERLTRVDGQFFHMRGLVYREFTSSVHEYSDDPKRHRAYQYPDPVWCVLDPHDRQPHHVLWAYVDRTDMVYVDRELVMACTLKELAKAILLTELAAGYKVRVRLIDPNFGNKPLLVTGRTVRQELASGSYSVAFGLVSDDKEAGHVRVKEALHWDRIKPLSLTNCPKIYFNRDRCSATIRSIRNYQYEEWSTRMAEGRDPKERPKQRDTHGADCVRYLLMSDPKFDTYAARSQSQELMENPY